MTEEECEMKLLWTEPIIEERWTEPASGIQCKVRQVPGGALCGYLALPPEAQLVSIHGGWTGGHVDPDGTGWTGFDTGHAEDDPALGAAKDVTWVRAECERAARAVQAATHQAAQDAIRAKEIEKIDEGSLQWVIQHNPYTHKSVRLVARLKEELVAMIVREQRVRRQVVYWIHRPKKCSEQRAESVPAAADALAARGVNRPPEELLVQLEQAQLRA